ncbi:Type 1 glutamine amidotransferase-like domain-containing protein [Planococcus sp. A6]|uniref:Type 1 glutamine amidotransferase-like domain-containing protein n=1 Tax=Planococcus sp. A6 TaxID=2992760 RepID=UPI00237A285F|nr:Type 1 glutamine amidotransferase-like domain-containing protein [Planococcus sp. A6]MDE0583060.1 Type 1 glutamine amidotransferase-like domain-containing protein [Planococcus sp. A6]
MKTHYYLGWFTDFFPENLSKALREDLTERKSLVMVSSDPSDTEVDGAVERSWLDQAGISFDEYHLIDSSIERELAHTLIRNASAIFLLGGDTLKQNRFLTEYELAEPIKTSAALIMGASAGAINMAAKWQCSERFGYAVGMDTVCDGLALDPFSVLSHFDLENNMALVQEELSALSDEMNVYASNKDCALRSKGGNIDILGDVYIMSGSDIWKLEETL